MGICHQVQLQGELETQLSFVPEHLRFMLQEARWEPASSRPTQGGQTSTQINSYCSYLSINLQEGVGKGTTQKLYKHFRNSTQRLHMQFSHSTSYKQEVIAVWKNPEDLLINSSRKKGSTGPITWERNLPQGMSGESVCIGPWTMHASGTPFCRKQYNVRKSNRQFLRVSRDWL